MSLDQITGVLQDTLDLGPSVFLPIVMFIGGMIIGMRPTQALGAGILLGVAFEAVNLVISFVLEALGPVGENLVDRTGLNLTAFDLGWTPVSALAWAWTWAALAFVIAIGVNITMLVLNKTRTLNVDLWNVWHLALMGAIISYVTGSLIIAFVLCVLWVVMQLKSADLTQRRVQDLTGIPGVAITHPMLFTVIWQYPIYRLIERIPGISNLRASPEQIRDKVGIFAENHVLGAIVGALIAIAAREPIGTIVTTAVISAAALTLFPMVASLFMKALNPVVDAANEFTRRRFPNREFFIGLDWPILAGSATVWTVAILMVPMIVIMAVILPGNTVLPYGSFMAVSGIVGAVVLTRGDMVKSLLLTLISMPVFFYTATWLAPHLTRLASTTGAVDIPNDVSNVSWLHQDTPVTTWFMAQIPRLFLEGAWYLALPLLVAGIALYFIYYQGMSRISAEMEAEEDLAQAEPGVVADPATPIVDETEETAGRPGEPKSSSEARR